jgi:Ca-activated chloride channel family protein
MRRISAILSLSLISLAMQGQSVVEKEFTLTADVDLVLLEVSVKGAKGGYLSGLTKDNFQVYENGQLQNVTQFSSEDTPITVGLVLDDSRSMRPKSNDVANAALAFMDSSNPKDEMFVTLFNDRVRHGLPPGTMFSDDIKLLRQALFNNPPDGMTSLYDGIVDALHQLESGHHEKRSLVLISDGGDNASTHGFKDVLNAVELNRATIYTVGVFDSDNQDRNPGLLHRLADISGGMAYLPKDLSYLGSICTGIAKDIRNRYSIGYVPVRADHSALRTIKVSVVGVPSQKIEIHARTSYLLPERLRKARSKTDKQ